MRPSAAPLGKQVVQSDAQGEKQKVNRGVKAVEGAKPSNAGSGTVNAEEAFPEDQSHTLLDRLIQLAEARIRQTQAEQPTCNHPSQAADASERGSPARGCTTDALNRQHELGNDQQASSTPSSIHDGPGSASGRQQLETALPEAMESDDSEFSYDDGLYGWPSATAVMCIRDDVCRLCLTEPSLERIIAQSVEEQFQSFTAGPSEFW